jgi:hypothetical protein
VYPGWKAKEIVRDAMLLSASESASPAEKVRNAREIVRFLQKVAEPDSVLARALADYQSMAAQTGDYYLLHEELEAFNSPRYVREMAARAHTRGLRRGPARRCSSSTLTSSSTACSGKRCSSIPNEGLRFAVG